MAIVFTMPGGILHYSFSKLYVEPHDTDAIGSIFRSNVRMANLAAKYAFGLPSIILITDGRGFLSKETSRAQQLSR